MSDRWYISGRLGVDTLFDEPTDPNTALSVSWAEVGTAIRHDSTWEALNLLDARSAGIDQGSNLNWWALNDASKAVRLGAITSRFSATADGASAGYLAFHTKPLGSDLREAMRITALGNVGIGTSTPNQSAKLHIDGGDLHVSRNLLVGAGGNGSLTTRHVDGKSSITDEYDTLYLNWGNRKPVMVGSPQAPSGLLVHGSASITGPLTVGAGGNPGGNAVLSVRHIDGKRPDNDEPHDLILNWQTETNVHVGGGKRSNLHVHGDTEIDGRIRGRSDRTCLLGHDGRWHWIMAGGEEEGVHNAFGFDIQRRLVGGGWTKSFVIDHPLAPTQKHLVHATLEGPEVAVFYRGEAALVDGMCRIELPEYFEALTRRHGRTVLVTPCFSGDEPVSALAASLVEEGSFLVRALDEQNNGQRFYWEVKAIRADTGELEVEQPKHPAEPASRQTATPLSLGLHA